MASQQVLFAETIIAMKKARKRKIVNHAGHQRAIISRNPPLIDDEGYELDSDDDEEQLQQALVAAAEFNPYANVRLENILSPLISVTDLPTHPTLSRPYTTKTLVELAEQGCNIMHKENKALWRIKHLQTRLMGDHTWIPCEMMLGPNDLDLYRDDYPVRLNQAKGSTISDTSAFALENPQGEDSTTGKASVNGDAAASSVKDSAAEPAADISMVDAEPLEGEQNTDAEAKTEAHKDDQRDVTNNRNKGSPIANTQEKSPGGKEKTEGKRPIDNPTANGVRAGTGHDKEAKDGIPQRDQPQREADSQGSRLMSVSPDPTEDLTIHPLFLAPRSAHPERDLGLPGDEAEDIRRLLQLYVQKQEEVCRGAKKLYEGLLQADRMRKTVLQWSKYEAHVGPNRDMSDGEDWYDKEEWGLEEDLRKGQDEEEEETTQPAKKTRTRR
ncbi:hypothetical protein SLS62_001619 [Diatrype stigma]|uniref:Transcriptional regulatory protein RXT2 N-terminal domain-containing protein n=1 Tax=Diatrype stigma TaxID=117547 RepID=A0AAN9YRL8_9PEZI